jgi:hypothetical protein
VQSRLNVLDERRIGARVQIMPLCIVFELYSTMHLIQELNPCPYGTMLLLERANFGRLVTVYDVHCIGKLANAGHKYASIFQKYLLLDSTTTRVDYRPSTNVNLCNVQNHFNAQNKIQNVS